MYDLNYSCIFCWKLPLHEIPKFPCSLPVANSFCDSDWRYVVGKNGTFTARTWSVFETNDLFLREGRAWTTQYSRFESVSLVSYMYQERAHKYIKYATIRGLSENQILVYNIHGQIYSLRFDKDSESWFIEFPLESTFLLPSTGWVLSRIHSVPLPFKEVNNHRVSHLFGGLVELSVTGASCLISVNNSIISPDTDHNFSIGNIRFEKKANNYSFAVRVGHQSFFFKIGWSSYFIDDTPKFGNQRFGLYWQQVKPEWITDGEPVQLANQPNSISTYVN